MDRRHAIMDGACESAWWVPQARGCQWFGIPTIPSIAMSPSSGAAGVCVHQYDSNGVSRVTKRIKNNGMKEQVKGPLRQRHSDTSLTSKARGPLDHAQTIETQPVNFKLTARIHGLLYK